MIIQLEGGQKLEVQDGATPEQIDGVLTHFQGGSGNQNSQQIDVAAPLNGQQSRTGTVGSMVMGAVDPVYGIGQMAPRALSEITSLGENYPNTVSRLYDKSAQTVDTANNARENSYDQARTAAGRTGIDWGRIAGNIVSPANAVPGKIIGQFPEAANLAGRLTQGAVSGGMFGATAPVNTDDGSYAGQKTAQVGVGAVGGAAIPAVGKLAAALVSPKISSNVQTLLDEGIKLTPGQILGPGAKKIEDKLTSFLPGVAARQQESIKDLNTAVANRALNPIGEQLPEGMAGRDANAYVQGKLQDAYNTLLPKMTGKNDAEFQNEINNLKGMVSTLPEQEQKSFNSVLDRDLNSRISPNGNVTGESLKDIESALNKQVTNYSGVTDAYQKQLGGAFKETQASLRRMIARNNPDYAGELQSINEGYANFARLRKASSAIGADEGDFTPAQLANAVRDADKTKDHGAYMAGNALMQDLSDPAKAVLPSKVPDSGTTGRMVLPYLAGGGAAVLAGHPLATMLGAGTMGLYTKPGQALARAILAPRPGTLPLRNAIEKYSDPRLLARSLTPGFRQNNP